MRAYLAALAKEGIEPAAVDAAAARVEMYGCGASRDSGRTYRWEYDGTYIYAADSKTVPAERTYWSDANGYLVGKHKGGPGQKWTITPWKTPEEPVDNSTAIALTGLFGPIAHIFG